MHRTRSSRRWAIRNQGGFNLIEVLASITIISVVAVGLTASTITTIKANATSRDAMTATTLAQDRIEQFRAMTFPAQLPQLTNGRDTVASDAGNTTFTREWAVGPGPTAQLAQVTVTVTWHGPEERSIRAVAYVCRTGTC